MLMTKYAVTHELDDHSSVIVNTLSGAVDILDNRHLPLLAKPAMLAERSPEVYRALLDRGYLHRSAAAEKAQLAELYARFSAYSRPTMFVICPTYACNLRCGYCFEGNLPQEQPAVLSRDQVDAAFAAISRLASGDAAIQLFGGEPFLPANRDIVGYIIENAAARGLRVSAVTNGVHLDRFIPLLTGHREHLIDFQVTVDGPAAIHDIRRPTAGGQGSFNDIVQSVDQALMNGLYIRLRVNVDRQNIEYLVELADFIKDKDWDKQKNFGALLSPVDDHSGRELVNRLSEDQLARKWLKLKGKHDQLSIFRPDLFRNLEYIMTTLGGNISFPRFQYCESNNLSCYTFGTDNHIYLCAEAIGDRRTAVGTYYPRFDLRQSEIDKWNGRSILTIEKCLDCPVATFCGGGCAYAAICINGSIDRPHCNGALQTLHAYLDSIKDELLGPAEPAGTAPVAPLSSS
jgi:uncharacterized protein